MGVVLVVMERQNTPRRLYYYTKVGSRDRGLVAERGSLESLTDVNHALCEVKSGALFGATEQSSLLQIQTSHGGSRH